MDSRFPESAQIQTKKPREAPRWKTRAEAYYFILYCNTFFHRLQPLFHRHCMERMNKMRQRFPEIFAFAPGKTLLTGAKPYAIVLYQRKSIRSNWRGEGYPQPIGRKLLHKEVTSGEMYNLKRVWTYLIIAAVCCAVFICTICSFSVFTKYSCV